MSYIVSFEKSIGTHFLCFVLREEDANLTIIVGGVDFLEKRKNEVLDKDDHPSIVPKYYQFQLLILLHYCHFLELQTSTFDRGSIQFD